MTRWYVMGTGGGQRPRIPFHQVGFLGRNTGLQVCEQVPCLLRYLTRPFLISVQGLITLPPHQNFAIPSSIHHSLEVAEFGSSYARQTHQSPLLFCSLLLRPSWPPLPQQGCSLQGRLLRSRSLIGSQKSPLSSLQKAAIPSFISVTFYFTAIPISFRVLQICDLLLPPGECKLHEGPCLPLLPLRLGTDQS